MFIAGVERDKVGSMASVLVVEDDARVQSALRSIFATDGGVRYTLAGEADTVTSAVTLARALRPDFLLLDLGLPDGHGTDVLRALRNEARLPLALVLTVFDDDAHIFGALRAGGSPTWS